MGKLFKLMNAFRPLNLFFLKLAGKRLFISENILNLCVRIWIIILFYIFWKLWKKFVSWEILFLSACWNSYFNDSSKITCQIVTYFILSSFNKTRAGWRGFFVKIFCEWSLRWIMMIVTCRCDRLKLWRLGCRCSK